MAENALDAKLTASLFSSFSRALLTTDLALADEGAPNEMPDGPGYSLPPGVKADLPTKSLMPTTGWSTLTLEQMDSKLIVKAGSAKTYCTDARSILRTCRPLSWNLLTVQVTAPDLAALLIKKGETPPLVIRRQTVEAQEQIIALHPSRQERRTGRRVLDDVEIGNGKTVVPAEWLTFTPGATLTVPVALVGTATAETWSQYLGYGENPLSVYLLLPPKSVRIRISENSQSGGVAGGTVNVGKPQAIFSWKSPDLGSGLSVSEFLSSYRLFVQKGNEAPQLLAQKLPVDKETAMIPFELIKDADRIGIASEDAKLTDTAGKALLSPAAWLEGGIGSIRGKFILPGGSNPFSDEYVPAPGKAITLVLTLPNGQQRSMAATSDQGGNFAFDNIPAWTKYSIQSGVYKNDGRMPFPAEKLTVSLGGIVVTQTVDVSPHRE